jgi:hypothetical protein
LLLFLEKEETNLANKHHLLALFESLAELPLLLFLEKEETDLGNKHHLLVGLAELPLFASFSGKRRDKSSEET